MKTHIIKPPELYDLQLLKQLFTLQHQKSELLITELKHLASDDDKWYDVFQGIFYIILY